MASLPTLADVARKAGVSTFTVSLALRQSPRVAEPTRVRVQEAARALGYRPNPLVKSLMATVRLRRRKPTGDVLGFIVSRETPVHPGQLEFQRHLADGAAARALDHGFRLEPIPLSSVGGSGRRLQQVLDARGIVGLVLPPVPSRDFRLQLAWDRLASVSVGHSFAEVPSHRVCANHFRLMRTAVTACRDLGWERPGLVLSQRLVQAADDTLVGGYLAATYLAGGGFPVPPLLYPGDQVDHRAFLDWVRAHRVGVVLSLRSDLASVLAEEGLEVGKDIGYALLDCQPGRGAFAGIDQRMRELGATAIDLLVQAMHANEFGVPGLPRIVELDGAWLDGPTLPRRTRPARRAATR